MSHDVPLLLITISFQVFLQLSFIKLHLEVKPFPTFSFEETHTVSGCRQFDAIKKKDALTARIKSERNIPTKLDDILSCRLVIICLQTFTSLGQKPGTFLFCIFPVAFCLGLARA